MIELHLVPAAGFTLPHRKIAAGEPLVKLQFSSQEDADFFRKNLRWSAFRFVAPAASPVTDPGQAPEKAPAKKAPVVIK